MLTERISFRNPPGAFLFPLAALLPVLAGGCDRGSTEPAGQDGWLAGSNQQRFDTVAKHLRGTDVAMIEIDHRYSELYWAGQDLNWSYAAYQLEKMETALRNAIERRPNRAQSAQLFLAGLPRMREAVNAGDPPLFAERFAELTTRCNACHAMEDMGYLKVRTPTIRITSVSGGETASDAGASESSP